MKVLVIISSLNSFEYILDTIVSVEVNAPEVDYLVIDRGSTDRTRVYLANNGIPRLLFPFEVDYYESISLGMKYAYENDYDAVVEFDDKGRHDSNDILYMVQTYAHTKVDMILASRYLEKTEKHKKALSNKLISSALWLSNKKRVSDPSNRFKLYGKAVIEFFAKTEKNVVPTPDIIAQLLKMGYEHKEVSSQLTKGKRQSETTGIKTFFRVWGWALSILFVQPFKRKVVK